MFHVQIGDPKVGKTKMTKQKLKKINNKIVIFDFNKEFNDNEGFKMNLDSYHPLVDELSLDDVKILNAAYLKTSRCLMNNAEEIFRDRKQHKLNNIIPLTLDRMYSSWNEAENEYERELSDTILLKTNDTHKSLNELVDIVLNKNITILQTKPTRSSHLRAIMYMLIYKLSKTDERIYFVVDKASSSFLKGNLKLFLEVVNIQKMEILLSCNKIDMIPPYLKSYISNWELFRNTNKSEIKKIRSVFQVGDKVDFEKMHIGEYKQETQVSS